MSTESQSGRSAEIYRRALETLPGGVSRNTVLRKPHPAYVAHASGCRVTDVEGVERIEPDVLYNESIAKGSTAE